ncbi:esterase-like activity of phytase family protein [Methylobrevis pamukkalensis]|uniref:Phytase-like domain-containing protein n=1 Tax=Methylobrevis pamukkalensis TaxID=1439726 RepID=A0A1E3H0K4_9HYPH|nr:esterase-like activity of phytase family protein [Methylobrevis pamukkalensis]ODN69868.1 hypothetical protein A6302_02803 [Methylobrevis pamukkalensis]
MTLRRALAAARVGLVACALAAGLSPAAARDGPEALASLRFAPLPSFRIVGDDDPRIGRLDYVGGFEIVDPTGRLGGLSALVLSRDGTRLRALSDDGVELRARLVRNAEDRPVGLADAAIRALVIADQRMSRKSDLDTEGFDLVMEDGQAVAYVSLEGSPRVARGVIGADGWIGELEKLDLPREVRRIDGNAGLESIAVAPKGSRLAGRFLAIAEQAPKGEADSPGWIFRQGTRDQRAAPSFTVALSDGYSVTDAVFLPGGDLLILERRFGFSYGVGMRLRRIPGRDIRPGARLDGKVLVEASLAHEIDNMEGLAVWRDAAGRTRLSLVSDDNHSVLQRTLYLEFVLAE